jgi:hypothetical protein
MGSSTLVRDNSYIRNGFTSQAKSDTLLLTITGRWVAHHKLADDDRCHRRFQLPRR